MPFFSENELKAPEFLQTAWARLEYGVISPQLKDRLLVPEEIPTEQKIVLLERLYQYVLSNNGDPGLLEKFTDFSDWIGERRPDPTPDQWLWLYTRIGERHRLLPMEEVFGMMAGRDALLPFLESVPDREIWNRFAPPAAMAEEPLPYPQIEEAIQADAPAKVQVYRMICRNVTDEQVFARAFYLKHTEIIANALQTMPPDQRIQTLIEIHTNWDDPGPLFRKVLPTIESEIAAWRDSSGNGFFWYLYRRPVLQKEVILSLPDAIMQTFNVPNRYGLSPADLWIYYRPRIPIRDWTARKET